ncbi:APC family permease [Pseudomonas monteilii]|uniref:APC family permease n=1 Tax=Pseudomonas monteilii TaxID=76759 RepID=UPI003800D484
MKSAKRNIGLWPLLLTGLGSIIGSGWLFGAWHASALAGPAAIFAWIIGAMVMLAIAVTYAEMGAMFPESGGMVRYARYSHGALVGFVAAWANWISIVSVIPIEAVASIQYMASWPYPWAQGLMNGHELTHSGLMGSAALVVVYFLLNYWGVKLFIKANSAVTIFKFVVPIVTGIALITAGFHTENFGLSSEAEFAPYGWSAVLTAVAASGIIFSYTGFQSPISLAGEAKNPGRNIPIAVLGSILIALVIYVVIQIAFIGAVSPSSVAHGWHNLSFNSPLAQLALALGLNWLAILLYIDAFISPSGTGVIYTATTARMIYGMERNNTLPNILGRVHPLYGIPRPAMWFNLLVSFVFLFFFRGWSDLAAVISVATVIAFLTGPISVMALRRNAPDLKRPIMLKAMKWVAPFAFVCASLVLYWARWPLTGQVILLVVAALPVFFYFQAQSGWKQFGKDLKAAVWLCLYLPAMALVSYCGSEAFGGIGLLGEGWDMVTVATLGLAFYIFGVRSGYRTPYLQESASVDVEAQIEEHREAERLSPRVAG